MNCVYKLFYRSNFHPLSTSAVRQGSYGAFERLYLPSLSKPCIHLPLRSTAHSRYQILFQQVSVCGIFDICISSHRLNPTPYTLAHNLQILIQFGNEIRLCRGNKKGLEHLVSYASDMFLPKSRHCRIYSLHSSVSELPKEKIVIFADRHRSDIGIKHSKNRPRTQAVADFLTATEVGNSHATD
jgi:hypothetical protein